MRSRSCLQLSYLPSNDCTVTTHVSLTLKRGTSATSRMNCSGLGSLLASFVAAYSLTISVSSLSGAKEERAMALSRLRTSKSTSLMAACSSCSDSFLKRDSMIARFWERLVSRSVMTLGFLATGSAPSFFFSLGFSPNFSSSSFVSSTFRTFSSSSFSQMVSLTILPLSLFQLRPRIFTAGLITGFCGIAAGAPGGGGPAPGGGGGPEPGGGGGPGGAGGGGGPAPGGGGGGGGAGPPAAAASPSPSFSAFFSPSASASLPSPSVPGAGGAGAGEEGALARSWSMGIAPPTIPTKLTPYLPARSSHALLQNACPSLVRSEQATAWTKSSMSFHATGPASPSFTTSVRCSRRSL
mmetsp:Transcript_773/g.2795  ORF Transcript_773/g.2795 Transcript_773/m.2795 type:complete len:353 (+) Transcript_773:936-1994(+)